MSKRLLGGVIGPQPSRTTASLSGIWTPPQQAEQKRLGTWSRSESSFSFAATGTGSTFGTWTANGVSSISGGTFTVMNNTLSAKSAVVHSEPIYAWNYNGLEVQFTTNSGFSSSNADAFGFGIFDYKTTTVNSMGESSMNAGVYANALNSHSVRFNFYSTNWIRVDNLGLSEAAYLATTVTGANTWKLVYSGSTFSRMTLQIYRGGSLLTTVNNVILPEVGRFAFGAGSGGATATVQLSSITFSFYR